MGVRVETTVNPLAVEFSAKARLALLEATQPVLEAAKEGAPWEPVPRHDEHLRDTGYVRLEIAAGDADRAVIGFTAFWAGWQHEHMDWHHEHGHAKFLELAVVGGAEEWKARVAEALRGLMAD